MEKMGLGDLIIINSTDNVVDKQKGKRWLSWSERCCSGDQVTTYQQVCLTFWMIEILERR